MTQNIPRPTWHKPPPKKSFWQKVFTGLFETLGGFLPVIPIPKTSFLRPMSYFVRTLEQKPAEKAKAASEQKVKELINKDVSRQVALWSEAADEEKDVTAYKVQSGDSLWKIAQNQYQDGMRWIDIWTANRASIKEPNLIFPDQELKLPKNILKRTALIKIPAAPAPTPKIKSAQGKLIKNQIVTVAQSIENVGINTTALINQKQAKEAGAVNQEIVKQINSNIIEVRQIASQANSISDFNADSVDLTVRTLDLGRETIQLTQTAVAQAPTLAPIAPTMAWSQDANGNIQYYIMQNGVWTFNPVNPIGNIGALYGTQDITQTPEYKSGKIIKIEPQPAPAAPATPAPTPYGGAILNTEQQAIYAKLSETRGAAAEQYKQIILGSSPLAVVPSLPAAPAAAAASAAGVSQSSSVLSRAVGNAVAADVALNNISITNADMVDATIKVVRNVATASAISAPASSANAAVAIAVAAGAQSVALSSAGNISAASSAAATATTMAIVANVAAPDSPQALAATQAAAGAIVMLQSFASGAEAATASAPQAVSAAAPSANVDSSSVSSADASTNAAGPAQGAAISSLGGGKGSVGGAFASAATLGLTNALGLTSDFGDQSVTLGQNVVSAIIGLGTLATGVPTPLGMVARGVADAINQSQANAALAAQQADMGLQAAYGSYRAGERSGVAPEATVPAPAPDAAPAAPAPAPASIAPTAMNTAALDNSVTLSDISTVGNDPATAVAIANMTAAAATINANVAQSNANAVASLAPNSSFATIASQAAANALSQASVANAQAVTAQGAAKSGNSDMAADAAVAAIAAAVSVRANANMAMTALSGALGNQDAINAINTFSKNMAAMDAAFNSVFSGPKATPTIEIEDMSDVALDVPAPDAAPPAAPTPDAAPAAPAPDAAPAAPASDAGEGEGEGEGEGDASEEEKESPDEEEREAKIEVEIELDIKTPENE